MLKATTLRVFPSAWSWRRCIQEAASAGYEGVEINFDGRLDLGCSKALLGQIKRRAREAGIKITSVYSRQQWLTPISSGDSSKREQGISALKRLIEIASYLEARVILVIPGAVDNSILSSDVEITPYEVVYERSSEAIRTLAPAAEKEGVVLAIENVPGKFLLSPLEMKRFIEEIGSPAVGCYFDVANCLYADGYPEQWIGILSGHIRNVHLKDYRLSAGGLSGFTDIFEGDVNWQEVAKALAETEYDYALTCEVLPPYQHHPERLWLDAASAIDSLREDIERFRGGMA